MFLGPEPKTSKQGQQGLLKKTQRTRNEGSSKEDINRTSNSKGIHRTRKLHRIRKLHRTRKLHWTSKFKRPCIYDGVRGSWITSFDETIGAQVGRNDFGEIAYSSHPFQPQGGGDMREVWEEEREALARGGQEKTLESQANQGEDQRMKTTMREETILNGGGIKQFSSATA
jgi:hypothetical protein